MAYPTKWDKASIAYVVRLASFAGVPGPPNSKLHVYTERSIDSGWAGTPKM